MYANIVDSKEKSISLILFIVFIFIIHVICESVHNNNAIIIEQNTFQVSKLHNASKIHIIYEDRH